MASGDDSAPLDGYVPFSTERADRYRDAGHWRDLTFHDVLDRAAAADPDRTAVIGPEGESSYRQLVDRSRRLAAALQSLGLDPNDRAVFQLPNAPAFLEAFFACSRIGVIPVMLLPRHREAEARHVVELTDARAYLTDAGRHAEGFDYVELVDGLREDSPHLEHTIAVTPDGKAPAGWTDFASLRDEARDADLGAVEVDPAEPGVMLLSGGTTGLPKAIPRTHNDYVFQWERMAAVAGIEPDWVAFPSVPIGHNASLCCVVGAAVWTGATLAVEPELKPEALMAFIDRVGGSYSLPMPTQIIDVLEHPDVDEYDLASLEVLVSGGQKVPPRVVEDAVERWDVGFCNIFGMAEGPLICTRPDDPVDVQAHTVGRPIAPEADELRVVDHDRTADVPPGEPGELAVRGPGYFTGYFRNPGENAENFDDEGWFYTEDVLARRDDGHYEVYGRIKDTIIRGGENIYAPGIEDELVEHPAIANAALVAMPDERLGERPAAFVELAEGADSLTLDGVVAFLDDRGVAVFKRPEHLEVVSELPRTEVGKIDKSLLEERIAEATGAGDREG
jgi:non-ribosomal peptide synthetase component E (peptide arylation enzyme)